MRRRGRAADTSSSGSVDTVAADLGRGLSQVLRALPSQVFCFSVRRFNKIGGRQPPAAVVGMGACQVRGGAGPRAKHGASAQPTHTRKGWAEIPCIVVVISFHVYSLSKRHVSAVAGGESCGAGWAEIPCATVFKHTTFQNVLTPCVENVLAVAGGKSWGRLGRHPLA